VGSRRALWGDNVMGKTVRLATKHDLHDMIAFWEQAGIYVDKMEESIDSFVVMRDDEERLLATIGFQPIGEKGLLRSLVIVPSLGERDLFVLFHTIMTVAGEKRMKCLYLVTNKQSSIPFFELLNFCEIEYEELPSGVRKNDYVRACMDNHQVHIMEYVF
jgi:N-acetylglutamate synthase-like GNAT family acetyltransferase